MTSHIALVKNMVCHRCVMAVEGILGKAGIPFQKVVIGEIYLESPLDEKQKATLSSELRHIGFDLIGNHMSGLIEKIKQHAIRKARNEVSDAKKKQNLSTFLSDKLNYEYTHLSSLFSSVEGRTIENFYIEQRIEKAKELLIYGNMTLSEIAFELDYSSTAHLSSQFKKITGLTPSHFKTIGAVKRKAIDEV